jgi:glycosyltransferase involved in cell wall biosynthesis
MEATFWKWLGVYRQFDAVICCSRFLKTKLDANPILAEKTVAMHNFVDPVEEKQVAKEDYVLYFGRFCKEKGTPTLVQVAKSLPEIPFVFAGTGPLVDLLKDIPNIKNVGFQTGDALVELIAGARLTVYPSEWYENCPFSVMESQMYGTPVLGADIGGISELIDIGQTGELFESGNAEQLRQCIESLWQDKEKLDAYATRCRNKMFVSQQQYYESLMEIYQ